MDAISNYLLQFCIIIFTTNQSNNLNCFKMSKRSKPEFMIIYMCAECHQDSGFTEHDKPICRYCDSKTEMTLISKVKITPEVMAERLKTVTDRMFSNLQSAFE